MARMKLKRRLCGSMLVPRRESDVPRFCSWQTRLNGVCAVGFPPDPFVAVGLAFFPVDDGEEFPEVPDGDELFVVSWPVMSAGEARFDTGGPGKT